MTSPFSSKGSPVFIELYSESNADWTAPEVVSIGGGTTVTDAQSAIDWSKFSGTPYLEIAFGHAAMSTAGASTVQFHLMDYTNATRLVTIGNTGSAAAGLGAGNIAASGYISGFSTFTKPAGIAKVGIDVQITDTAGRVIGIYKGRVWIIP